MGWVSADDRTQEFGDSCEDEGGKLDGATEDGVVMCVGPGSTKYESRAIGSGENKGMIGTGSRSNKGRDGDNVDGDNGHGKCGKEFGTYELRYLVRVIKANK